jgi:ABC-type oligopeptide transport system ATPase subunit
MQLQQSVGVIYLFIGHDLATVARISHRIAAMYLGRIVESAESTELVANRLHPYAQALLTTALSARRGRCTDEMLVSREIVSGHTVACHLY